MSGAHPLHLLVKAADRNSFLGVFHEVKPDEQKAVIQHLSNLGQAAALQTPEKKRTTSIRS